MTLEGEWESKYKSLTQELANTNAKAQSEQNALKQEIDSLKRNVTQLKETTKVGQIQKAYDDVNVKNKELETLIASLQDELENALHERDTLSEQLIDMEETVENRVSEKTIETKRHI